MFYCSFNDSPLDLEAKARLSKICNFFQFQLAVKSVRKYAASIPLFNLLDSIMLVATEQTGIIIIVFSCRVLIISSMIIVTMVE